MSLKLIDPPNCEPVSLLEMCVFLKIPVENQEENLMKNLIKTARQAVEAFTARALIHQSWRFQSSLAYGLALSDEVYLSGHRSRGLKGLELPRSPFIELIGKPKFVDDYGTHDISNYRLDAAGRSAKMHFGNLPTEHYGFLQIDFIAGYGDKPEDVPEPLRHGILMMAAELYENRAGVNDNQGLPLPLCYGAVELIKPYRSLRLT